MGLFRRHRETTRRASVPAQLDPEFTGQPVELTGTTTFGAASLDELLAAHRAVEREPLLLAARLVPEPDNEHDAQAIFVQVEGARIGYLPSYVAHRAPSNVSSLSCTVQLWFATAEKGRRVRGWVAVGRDSVRWPHDATNPPTIAPEDRRAERAAATTAMVSDALAGGGQRAREIKRGMVGKYHYLETVEPIQQLKREKRFEEALALCYGAIEAAENDARGREPAPWYTEQAAIIHRKLGQRDEEIAVLERWITKCPIGRRGDSSIQARLNKMRA